MFSPYFGKFGWKTPDRQNRSGASLMLFFDNVSWSDNDYLNTTFLPVFVRYNLFLIRWYTNRQDLCNGYDLFYLPTAELKHLAQSETYVFNDGDDWYVLDTRYLDSLFALAEYQGLVIFKQLPFLTDPQFFKQVVSYLDDSFDSFYVYFSGKKVDGSEQKMPELYSACPYRSFRFKYFVTFLLNALLIQETPNESQLTQFQTTQNSHLLVADGDTIALEEDKWKPQH